MRLITVVAILTTVIGTTPVFAANNIADTQVNSQTTTSSSVNVDLSINPDSNDLSAKDLSTIKEKINSILSSKYEIMKTNKVSKDYSNIIGDSKLLELINKTNNLNVNWLKKFTKIDTYTSNVTVTNSTKTATNTYVLNVLYDVNFKLHGMTTLSESKNEKYRFEVKCKDSKWYITKMVDLNNEDDISTRSNQIIDQTNSTSDSSTSFSDYDNSIDLQIKNIDEKSKNIDNVFNYYKMQNNLEDENTSTLASSTYQYNSDAAVSYARKYALPPYNGAYTYYSQNGDCTNFVSQCVKAGGIPTNPGVWMPGQYDWNTVAGFYTYMTNYGYAKAYTWTSGARIGDVVQWYNPSSKEWSHAVILTGTSGNDWLFCSHSNNRKDYPLYATYQSSTFTNLRTIAFWH